MKNDDVNKNHLILLPMDSAASTDTVTPDISEKKEETQSDESPPEHLLSKAIEGILFVSSGPVSVDTIAKVLNTKKSTIRSKLRFIRNRLNGENHGFFLDEVSGGWQFLTRNEISSWVSQLSETTPIRLSKASLEVLSIIAYRQPIIRSEIEVLRGTNSSNIVRNLIEWGLIEHQGYKELPGRPEQFGTSNYFLEVFSLRDLSELPTLRDVNDFESRASFGSPVVPPEENTPKIFSKFRCHSFLFRYKINNLFRNFNAIVFHFL